MTKLGILQLPYNLDSLRQIIEQLSSFNGKVYFIDLPERVAATQVSPLPDNIAFVTCPSYETDSLVEIEKTLALDNLISFAELGLIPAAHVRDALSMPGHNVETELNSVDKYKMRQLLIENGLTLVKTTKCRPDELAAAVAHFGLPAIAKPSSLTGSIGVQLLEQASDLNEYIARINSNVYSKGCELVLESYIPGAEYSVEGLLLNGTIHIYGVTEKQTTQAPYFVETGHRFNPNHPLLSWLYPTLQEVFVALSMTLCPFHIEFKIVDERLEVIEIHSRFGGDFITKLLEYSLGNKAFLEYVEYLCHGIIPRINRHDASVTAVQFSTVPAGVVQSVSTLPPAVAACLLEYKIGVKPGDVIRPQTGFYDRPAFFISRLKDEHEARTFQQCINDFKIELAIKEQA